MTSSNNQDASAGSHSLKVIDSTTSHTFITPVKKINEGHDVSTFLTSEAYRDIGVFISQLNISMCPRKGDGTKTTSWPLNAIMKYSPPVQQLQELLRKIESIIEEAPPDTGPRRFGNVSFRTWYELLEGRIEDLLRLHLPQRVLNFPTKSEESSALQELTPYIMGGFGSAQRLDYGTGHELSFLAFLGCLVKLGAFSDVDSKDGSLEREIVIGVIEPYLKVVRRLILTYTLEPAGSHGVWGLDDHSFIPYILGASQYSPAIDSDDAMPTEGALRGSPKPGDVVKKNIVVRERQSNMYFAAVGFIYDVKTGPFWEHSPMLFDISGVPQGWAKINKGMIKMYNAEVLSKFPVVQHFPFGSLFSWDQDVNAAPRTISVHTSNQPARSEINVGSEDGESTKAPWLAQPTGPPASTNAATARGHPQQPQVSTRAPWAHSTPTAPPTETTTRASWTTQTREHSSKTTIPSRAPDGPTTAPWARKT